MYMDAYMGGVKNAKLANYLLDPVIEEVDDLSDNDLKEYFGFNPINASTEDG
jgi:acid phosphatase family membrane protein YuiD